MEENTPTAAGKPDRGWLKRYLPLFFSQSFSLLGSTLVNFAIVWWLTESTGSASVLAMGTIIIIIPGALIGPLLGTLVDRFDRRWVLALTDAVIALGTVFLALMFWLERIEVWHIYVVFALSSIFGTLQWTANTAMMSSLVPDEQLQRVQGMSTTLQSAVHIAGAPLGAVLMSFLPMYGVLAIDVVTAAIAISILLLLRLPKVLKPAPEPGQAAEESGGMWQDFRVGLRFLLGWRGLLYVIVAVSLMNAIHEPVFTFFPLLVTEHFGLGALELSSITAVWGLGMVAGGLLMSVWGGFKKKIYTMILSNFLMGIFLAVVAAARPGQFWLALTGIFLMASVNPMNNSSSMAILQSRVPKHLQGRVLSLASSLVGISIPLSLAIMGPLAERTGVHVWYWVGAVGMIGISLFFFIKPIRTIEEQRPPENLSAAEVLEGQ